MGNLLYAKADVIDHSCKLINLSENNFSIIINKTNYSMSLILYERTINLTFISPSAFSYYEGIFTYDDFLNISKCFYLQETLKEIYEILLLKLKKQEVIFTEDYTSIILKMEFSFNSNELKKYQVEMKIHKIPEKMDLNLIHRNMSKTFFDLTDTLNKMKIKNDDQEKMIQQINLKNKELDRRIKDIVEIKSDSFYTSTIVMKEEEVMIRAWLNFEAKFVPLYKSTWCGKGARKFHSKCDNKGPTITFIETTDGFRFGGFTTLKWESISGFRGNDPYAFLFSLDKNKKLTCNDQRYVICCKNSYGACFGSDDIYIGDNFNGSSSKLYYYGKSEGVGSYYLTGNQFLSIKEIEVYSVTK